MNKIFVNIASMIFFISAGLNGQDVPQTLIQPDQDAAEEVFVNGIALSANQIAEMEQNYGAKPLPGNYWYVDTLPSVNEEDSMASAKPRAVLPRGFLQVPAADHHCSSR